MVRRFIISAIPAISPSRALDHRLPLDHYIGQLSKIINLSMAIRSVNRLLLAQQTDKRIAHDRHRIRYALAPNRHDKHLKTDAAWSDIKEKGKDVKDHPQGGWLAFSAIGRNNKSA